MSQVIGLPKGKRFVWHTLETKLRDAIMAFRARTGAAPTEIYVPQALDMPQQVGEGVSVIQLSVCGYICVGPLPEPSPEPAAPGISVTVPSLMARFKRR